MDRSAPHIVGTLNGVSTSVLLRPGSKIGKTPRNAFDQVTTVGDTSARTDQRTPQVIATDQRGGMGQLWYLETEGVTRFAYSTCETRYPGMVTLPPAKSTRGSAPTLGGAFIPSFVEYLGTASVSVIAWAYGTGGKASRLNAAMNTWTTIQASATDIVDLSGYAYFRGYYLFATTAAGIGIYTSTDGTTWNVGAKAKACIGLATHDNKIWTFNNTDKTLDFATDPTAAHASWGTSSVLYLHPGEAVTQVAEWRDIRGRAAVYLVTTRRVIWYDEDADAFLDYYQAGHIVTGTTAHPRLAVSPRDGNATLTLYDTGDGSPSDRVITLSGTTGTSAPGAGGGLPDDFKVKLLYGIGTTQWLLFGGVSKYVAFSAGTKKSYVFALNELGGWHFLAEYGYVHGIGYGGGYLYVLWSASGVTPSAALLDRLPLADTTDTPLTLATGSYAASGTHTYAFTDGGTENTSKNARWVEISCRDHTATFQRLGLASGTSVAVYYQRDEDTARTLIGTVTSATTFPARLAIGAGGVGVNFQQIRLSLDLATSDATHTPIVTSVALAYVRQEVPRYAYTFAVDLGDREHPLYRGEDVPEIRAQIDAWTQPGAIVRLDYAGGDWGTSGTTDNPSTAVSIANCTVQYSATDDPETGPDQMTIVFSDVTPPSSG